MIKCLPRARTFLDLASSLERADRVKVQPYVFHRKDGSRNKIKCWTTRQKLYGSTNWLDKGQRPLYVYVLQAGLLMMHLVPLAKAHPIVCVPCRAMSSHDPGRTGLYDTQTYATSDQGWQLKEAK